MEVPHSGLRGPHMILGVICDHALVGQDGKLTLVGIFDRLQVPVLPIQHPRFFLVAVFDIVPGTYTVTVAFTDPTGHNVLEGQPFQVPVTVTDGQGRGNLIAELNMLPLEFSGQYSFDLTVGDTRIGSIPLAVELAPQNRPVGQPAGQA